MTDEMPKRKRGRPKKGEERPKVPKKPKKRGRPKDEQSKRSRGVQRRSPEKENEKRVVFHVDSALYEAMIAMINASSPKTTVRGVGTAALQGFLHSKGYWPSPPRAASLEPGGEPGSSSE